MRWAAYGLALLMGPAAGQGVFKWTDEHGRVHYGDRTTAVNARAVPTPEAPAPDPDTGARRTQQQRLLDAFARERREQQERTEQAEREERDRAERCARAREQARGIESAGLVYQVDAQGSRRYLDDAERARAVTEAKRAIAQWCR